MQAITRGLDDIEQHILLPSVDRSYTTTVFNSVRGGRTYDYREPEIKRYVFRNARAISGSQTGQYPGVLCGRDFHLGDFGKGNKASRSRTPFWAELDPKRKGVEMSLHLEDKETHTCTEPVNVVFNLGFYYHWFYEDLALFTFMRANDHKIITRELTAYQWESLDSMPDIKSRIVELPAPWIVDAPEIHTYTKPDSGQGATGHWVAEFLRETYRPRPARPHRRIYISRNSDSAARGVDNEDEVRDYLEARGFEYFDSFARLDLQAKVDLLHETELAISAAGSNLSHVYAMQPGTRIIDFNHRFLTGVEHWYKSVGTVAQLDWTSCGMQTGSASGRARTKNNNMIVDTDLLGKAIG